MLILICLLLFVLSSDLHGLGGNFSLLLLNEYHNVAPMRSNLLINATFLVLCRNNELYDILPTLQSVQDRFNKNYNYDYVFLNDEPFDDTFKETVLNYLSLSVVQFGRIPVEHWLFPEWIDLDQAQNARHEMSHLVYGDSISYRHMCRWYSGFFYKHELLQKYDYYWRLEPGIKLLCDINYDIFQYMHENQKKFAFTLLMFEYSETIPLLWNSVTEYRSKYPINGELLPMIENDDSFGSYNLCHFWSNFEIANFNVFRSANYSQFFDFLDHKGGFYYERWGDAPIHSIYMALYLLKSDILYLNEVGYNHSPYTQCPNDKTLYFNNKCVCDPNEDFTNSFQSCTPHFIKILND